MLDTNCTGGSARSATTSKPALTGGLSAGLVPDHAFGTDSRIFQALPMCVPSILEQLQLQGNYSTRRSHPPPAAAHLKPLRRPPPGHRYGDPQGGVRKGVRYRAL